MKPIIMSTEDVRGILDGCKTMARIPIRTPHGGALEVHADIAGVPRLCERCGDRCRGLTPPYEIGDVLISAVEIDGQSEQYCAGSDGYVYSQKQGEWKRLAGCPTSKGYLSVTLSEYGERSTKSVSVVICKAFYGDPPNPHSQVRHLNGVQTDNRPANLAWGTQYENWADRKTHGHGIEGEKHPQSKFTNEERANIRWAISNGLTSIRNAARALCVSQTVIQGVVKGNELITIKQEIPKNRFPELFLRVKDVRVERVQDITDDGSIKEGCTGVICDHPKWDYVFGCADCMNSGWREPPRLEFSERWDARNAKRGYGWDTNPYVWVIEFERISSSVIGPELNGTAPNGDKGAEL